MTEKTLLDLVDKVLHMCKDEGLSVKDVEFLCRTVTDYAKETASPLTLDSR